MRSEATREKDRLRTKARAERLKEQGLCIKCGKKPPVEGKVHCEECAERGLESKRLHREREKARLAKRYADAKAQGMCVTCFQHPAAAGHVHCAYCIEKRRQYDLQRRKPKAKYWSTELGEEYTAEEMRTSYRATTA